MSKKQFSFWTVLWAFKIKLSSHELVGCRPTLLTSKALNFLYFLHLTLAMAQLMHNTVMMLMFICYISCF